MKCEYLLYVAETGGRGLDREVDTWFRNFNQFPIIEILDKMVEMLKSSGKSMGRDARGLIYRKLSKQRKEINRPLAKNGTYLVITKSWLFSVLGVRSNQTKGSF